MLDERLTHPLEGSARHLRATGRIRVDPWYALVLERERGEGGPHFCVIPGERHWRHRILRGHRGRQLRLRCGARTAACAIIGFASSSVIPTFIGPDGRCPPRGSAGSW